MKLKDLIVERRMSALDAAKRVATTLKKRYGYWNEDSSPGIRKNEDGSVSVYWEEGPPQWATGDSYWAFEELASMMSEFGGPQKEFNEKDYPPTFDDIPGFTIEAVNGVEVAIYRD